jgi:dCMP deaminase
MIPKRKDYLSWPEYFMFNATLASKRSKDPNTQVGACIIDLSNNHIVSNGYNGLPRGCDDDDFPWNRKTESDDLYDTKYPYVVHAERNAIYNAERKDLKNCELYVTLFPCNECTKSIIQVGIKRVYYATIKSEDSVEVRASQRMLAAAGVEIVHFKPERKLSIS